MPDDSNRQKYIKHLASYFLIIFGFEHCGKNSAFASCTVTSSAQ